VSSNFFRTRDTARQDIIDQSQLIRVLAFVPGGAPPTGHAIFDHMIARGVIIDPREVYFTGQSLGSIQGTPAVAANPRISKAVFNVGGGTVVDVFTNSPAFAAGIDQLLASLGIVRGTSAFLQFLVVAKTVLDGSDPINFAGHLTGTQGRMLPNFLAKLDGSVAQTPKKVLAQVAHCDATLPNPFSFLLASNLGVSPLPGQAGFGTAAGTFQLFAGAGFTTVGACSASTAVQHGFVTDWASATLTSTAQADLAQFLMSNTAPPSLRK